MNNYLKTEILKNQFNMNDILSVSFILDGKIHQIKYINGEFLWCSIKTIVSNEEEKIFQLKGEIKELKELSELRNFILTKI